MAMFMPQESHTIVAKNKTISSVTKEYIALLERTMGALDTLIYEVEHETSLNPALRKESLEMAMDSVPLLRCLKEAKKQAAISLSVYQI